MRLLLDTHYAYALAGAPGRFSPTERRFLSRPPAPLAISAVSIWEIRLKWQALHPGGDRKGPLSPEAAVQLLEAQNVEWLPLLPSHAAARLTPELGHNDPFDELLLAQAQVEGMRLVTRDGKLVHHPLALPPI